MWRAPLKLNIILGALFNLRGFWGGPDRGSHDAERRQPAGRLYARFVQKFLAVPSTFAVRETQSLGQQMLKAPRGINGLMMIEYDLHSEHVYFQMKYNFLVY